MKLRRKFPQYDDAQWDLVLEGLRDWFAINQSARGARLPMPSQAVDEAWHEFILFTHHYADFCDEVLGRFLHHVPAEAMQAPTQAQSGIRRVWRLACERERIRPRQPLRLPRLFAVDAELAFPNGFVYAIDCMRAPHRDGEYCATSIACSAGGCSGDGGGCSGGDGGGDGGGCGGCGGD